MYNDIVIENFTDPTFVGDLQNADVEFEIGNPVCGDRIRIQLSLKNRLVDGVAFRAWGCATSVATANIFCRSIQNKSIVDIESRSAEDQQEMLGELEPSQRHCLEILDMLHARVVQEVEAVAV